MGKRERQSLPILGSWDQRKKELAKIKNYFKMELGQEKASQETGLNHKSYLAFQPVLIGCKCYSQIPKTMVKLCITSSAGGDSASRPLCPGRVNINTAPDVTVKHVATILFQPHEK